MKAGVKDLCGALSTVLSLMAALASLAAVQSGNRELYVQAVLFGLLGAGVALAALLRM